MPVISQTDQDAWETMQKVAPEVNLDLNEFVRRTRNVASVEWSVQDVIDRKVENQPIRLAVPCTNWNQPDDMERVRYWKTVQTPDPSIVLQLGQRYIMLDGVHRMVACLARDEFFRVKVVVP